MRTDPQSAPTPLAVGLATLAGMLEISERAAQRLAAAGKLPEPITIGSRRRWALDGPRGVRAWIAAGAPDREKWNQLSRGATAPSTHKE